MKYRTPRTRLVLVVVALIALAATSLMFWRAHSQSDVSQGAKVAFYVDHPEFSDSGRRYSDALREKVGRLMPGVAIDWHFVASKPMHDRELQRAMDAMHPQLVILATADMLSSDLDSSSPSNFLVSTDWSPRVVRERTLRSNPTHKVAVISWFAPNQDKLFELLTGYLGRKPEMVTVFFDEELVLDEVPAEFALAAGRRRIKWSSMRYSGIDEFGACLAEAATLQRPDALILPLTPTLTHDAVKAAAQVAAHRLPAAYSRRDQVRNGGLIATDPPPSEISNQLARYAALILRGAAASSLDIGTPSRLETTVNLSAAARIGRPVPYEILVEASEIVE